jgi:hypothetical protein
LPLYLPLWFSTFAYRGAHIGARELLDINLIWFGYIIARLSHWGGRGYFTR